jgi:VCBS repeat-containing protein
MQNNKQKTVYNISPYKKHFVKGFIFFLTIILICSMDGTAIIENPTYNTIQNQDRNIIWDVTLHGNNSAGQNDNVVFGEAPDANDGPPADSYDVVKPPAPIPPYIRLWFNDSLPIPYDTLWKDYRHYPGTTKVWNLTVHWMPSGGSSPTTVTLWWNTAEFNGCEYISVALCTNGGAPLQNMLLNSSYVFSCPAYVPQNFKIICIASSNHPPVANSDNYSTNEDTVLSVSAPGVLGNDVDIDGDPLTAVKVSDPSHGIVVLNSNGGFSYTPSANYHGSDSFTYKAYDGTVYSNIATVTITVNSVNDPPVAYPDSYSTDEDTVLTVVAPGVLGNDVDVDGDTLTAVKVSDPSHGSIVLNSNGGFTFTPSANYHGTDSFTYQAYDGIVYSSVVTVSITINSVNDPPIANPDSYSTNEGTPLTIVAPGVLGNDVDVDGDTLTAVKVSDPSHGTVVLNNDGGFTYTPNPNYNGNDSFTYKAYDGILYSNVATVTITVNQGNHPPVANNDSATVLMDSTINTINVLANDVDEDGDPLIITSVSGAPHGTTTTDGNFVYYTPTHGYSGSDSFTYSISDSHGGTDTGTVSITVQPNAPPLKPSRPTGPSSGKIRKEYTYNATTTDPNNHQVYYMWDWGDGTTSEWVGPYNSGVLTQAKHTWTKKGSYGIKVKAKDSYGAESNWSDPLPITMPLSQNYGIHNIGVLFHLILSFLKGEYRGMTFLQVLIMGGWFK